MPAGHEEPSENPMAAEESQIQPATGTSPDASVLRLTAAQLHRLSRHIQVLSEVSPSACSMPGKLSCTCKAPAAWCGLQGSIAGLVHNSKAGLALLEPSCLLEEMGHG